MGKGAAWSPEPSNYFPPPSPPPPQTSDKYLEDKNSNPDMPSYFFSAENYHMTSNVVHIMVKGNKRESKQ